MSPAPLTGRVDQLANAIASRVVAIVVDAIDFDEVLSKVDVNAIVDEIDIDALMRNTELGSVIARSTSGLLTEALDIVRSQAVGLDDFIARWTYRLLRRRIEDLPAGPPLLAVPAPDVERGE
jgi:CBS-domain-containing membrane protein